MESSIVDYVAIPKSTTLRSIAVSRRSQTSLAKNFRQFSRKVRETSWLALLLCCLLPLPLNMAAPLPTVAPEDSVTETLSEDHEEFDLHASETRTSGSSLAELANKRPMWSNPCGWTDSDIEAAGSEDEGPTPTVAELAEIPARDIKTALRQARQFSEKFVQTVFRQSFEQHAKDHSHIADYEWLNEDHIFGKDFNIDKCPDIFRTINFEGTLKDMYLALQKVAIGVEQSLLDQVMYNEGFQREFQNIEVNLRSVLCSLQEAMYSIRVRPHPDAERQLMSMDYRDLRSASARNQRDFLILRKYIQLLECMEHALQYFRDQPTNQPAEYNDS